MSAKNKPLSRKDGLVVQELNGETLIYDLKTNKALCLNETSALIWAACDGTRDISELGAYASQKLNAPVNDDLIWLALDQLEKEHLLAADAEAGSRFTGLPRREVVKRIGLAAAIAVPVVSTIVAPFPIHAASLLASGAPAGNATLTGNCPSSTPAQKDTACDAQRGSVCASGHAHFGGSCSGNPSSFTCICN